MRTARPGNWWFSKIPPLLAIVCLEILRVGDDPLHAHLLLVCYLWSISAVAAYGHVINDAFDVESDRSAGKTNHMTGVSRRRRTLLCGTYLFAGFAPTLIAHYSSLTLLLLALNFLWPTIYSLPPVRLKERGLAALICDMLGSHVTPTLIALSMFGMTQLPELSWFSVIVTIWAAALGFKGILHHQAQDRANDLLSGTVTLATRASGEGLSRFLTRYNLYVELPVSAALALVTLEWAPFVAAAFAAYWLLEMSKYWLGFQFALTSETWTIRRSVPFTNEAFYVLWLPLVAALQLAADQFLWIWLPIVLVILFYPNVSAQLTDIKAVLRATGRTIKGAE